MDFKDEIEEKPVGKLKKVATDILDVVGDTVGIVANPSILALLVLWNSLGGRGFDGYVTNPQ